MTKEEMRDWMVKSYGTHFYVDVYELMPKCEWTVAKVIAAHLEAESALVKTRQGMEIGTSFRNIRNPRMFQ